jgi:hypothetical protein
MMLLIGYSWAIRKEAFLAGISAPSSIERMPNSLAATSPDVCDHVREQEPGLDQVAAG